MSAVLKPAVPAANQAARSDAQGQRIHFRPWNVGRWVMWGVFALLLIVAPLLFTTGLAMTMLSQMGYMIIICLSYNLLLGQGGMLSFGHAVYVGLGAFFAIHTMNLIGAGRLPLPMSLVPLVGGLAGAGVAALLGWVTTKKSANTFAMITLGVGELVAAMALMFPEFFGGEGGVSSNRVAGKAVLGITFGPQVQVYYLIAIYCFVCTAALYALTRTPFGRMLNAVRDLAFVIAGFFAGIGGGLTALNFEIVTADSVGGFRSGSYLLFTFLGGAFFFFGPIIGAVLLVLAFVLFSEITKAWQIYLGLVFMFMVMFAPGGISSLIMMNLRVAGFGKLRRLASSYLALGGTGAVALAGAAAIVEMIYHVQLNSALGPTLRFMGGTLNVQGLDSWFGAVFVMAIGIAMFELARREFKRQWDQTQQEIEKEIKRREAL
jgi:branched-chain amino acid transport system permease protein